MLSTMKGQASRKSPCGMGQLPLALAARLTTHISCPWAAGAETRSVPSSVLRVCARVSPASICVAACSSCFPTSGVSSAAGTRT